MNRQTSVNYLNVIKNIDKYKYTHYDYSDLILSVKIFKYYRLLMSHMLPSQTT